MRHIISILIENESGALSRVAGLFFARGFNIESLSVAPTDDESLSRMTLVTSGSDEIIEQIKKQLNKLIEVVKLVDLSNGPHIEREMAMIKVRAESPGVRDELNRLTDIFRGRVIDVTDTTYILEMTGSAQKIDALIATLDPAILIEVIRTGPCGISRGSKSLRLN